MLTLPIQLYVGVGILIACTKHFLLNWLYQARKVSVMYMYMYAGRDILASAWNEGQPFAGPKKIFGPVKKLESLVQMA